MAIGLLEANTDVTPKTGGIDLSILNNQKPLSLEGAAEQVKNRIDQMSASFNSQFHAAMRGLDELNEMTTYVNAGMSAGLAQLNELWELAKTMNNGSMDMPESEREEARLQGLQEMMQEYGSVRSYIRTTTAQLEETASVTNERTDAETRKMIIEQIQPSPAGSYLLQYFKEDVHALLDGPINTAALEDLKKKVSAHLQANPDASLQAKGAKITLAMTLRMLINDFQFLGKLKGNSHLSIASIQGMFGRVPSEDEMQNIFDNTDVTFETIKKIPAGSIRITLADRIVDFYHEEGDTLPADIAKLVSQEPRFPILHIHYRTDADVGELLADMSKGEFLSGKTCVDGECVTIEGRTDSPDFDIHQAPDSLVDALEDKDEKKEEDENSDIDEKLKQVFLASPMKYLSHDLAFSAVGNGSQKKGEQSKA